VQYGEQRHVLILVDDLPHPAICEQLHTTPAKAGARSYDQATETANADLTAWKIGLYCWRWS
jgi:hypothetical protein